MRSLSDGRLHPKSAQKHMRPIRTLLPYLWPKNAKEIRLRVVTALIFLAAAKAITVGVPFIYKLAVDQISVSVGAAVVVPIGLLIAYGLARVLSQTFGELRDAVFAKVAQRAIRKAGLRTFQHLHSLAMRFHLERQTGGLSLSLIHI